MLPADEPIPYDASKINSTLMQPCADTDRVTFRKASGGANPLFQSPQNGRSGYGIPIRATCLTFDGIDINAVIALLAKTGPSDNPSSITFENAKLEHNFGGETQGTGLGLTGNYITLKNLEIGPSCCDIDGVEFGSPSGVSYGITIDHVYIHDIVDTSCARLSSLASWPTCSTDSSPFTGNHNDCIQSVGAGNLTMTNSLLLNCPAGSFTTGVFNTGNTYFNILLENNVFDGHQVQISCGGTCTTVNGNQYAVKAVVPPGYPNSGTPAFFKLLYNNFGASTSLNDFQPGGDYELIGNIDSDVSPSAGSCDIAPTDVPGGTTAHFTIASYNMFAHGGATACNGYGVGNINAAATYVDLAHLNYHLANGSSGIDAGPTTSGATSVPTDLDSHTRPCGAAWDVGPYEANCGP